MSDLDAGVVPWPGSGSGSASYGIAANEEPAPPAQADVSLQASRPAFLWTEMASLVAGARPPPRGVIVPPR